MWSAPVGKQKSSIDASNARLNLWHGAVRSSKTVGANYRWMLFIAEAVKNNVHGDLLMFGKTERTLKRNILDPLAEYMGPNRFRYNKGEGEAYMWGRKIHIAGANDERAEGKIRGGTYLAAYGDELTLIPESFFKMLLSRLSLPGAKLFGTTNPDSPYHWLKAEYMDKEGLDLESFHFTLDDNPFLDPTYVEELKKEYTGLWYKRFILGLWVQAAGAVYDMWSDENVCRADPEKVTSWFADCDYGTSNPCTFSLKGTWMEGDKRRVHTFKEYFYDGRDRGQKTDAEYVSDLVEFLGDKKSLRLPIYTDPSAASFIVAGRKGGFRMVEADNEVIDGIRFTSSFIQDGTYTVDPSCKETIKGYQAYIWDEKAQKRGEDKPLKENDHTCDRDRYGIYTHFGGERKTKGGTRVTL